MGGQGPGDMVFNATISVSYIYDQNWFVMDKVYFSLPAWGSFGRSYFLPVKIRLALPV